MKNEVLDFSFYALFRPFRETHRVKSCNKNDSLFLIVPTQEDGAPSYVAEVRIHFARTFTRSEPLRFLSLGLCERLNQEKIPAMISQMNQQVKDIIESISYRFIHLTCIIYSMCKKYIFSL